MAVERKRARQTGRRTAGKATRTSSHKDETGRLIERIDILIDELQAMRRHLATMPEARQAPGLSRELFGAAGQGSLGEYDQNLDWMRFSDWQLR
jgi:hypothetical protein